MLTFALFSTIAMDPAAAATPTTAIKVAAVAFDPAWGDVELIGFCGTPLGAEQRFEPL